MTTNPFALDDCIEICLDTSETCLLTAASSLGRADRDESAQVPTIQLCAESCQLAAKAMILGSPIYQEFLALCAKVCEQCADECESYEDEEMDACAQSCRQCAILCRAVTEGTTIPLRRPASANLRI